MSLELPRLPRFSIIVTDFLTFAGSFRHWYDNLQIWWQQVVEAIEAHELVQEGILANLSTTDATITDAQAALAATQAAQAQTQADLAATQATLTVTVATLNDSVTALEAAESAISASQEQIVALNAAGALYVLQDVGPAWTAWTGTASRATAATYTAPVISNPPTQAEVQAMANALQANSRALMALIADLQGNGALT